MGRITHRWSSEEEAVVIAEYPSLGAGPIAKRMGISDRAVTHKANRLGVVADRKIATFERNKKSKRVNAVYFDGPWHPEMAYVAGYIHADANITQGAIQLDCVADDEELVYNVRDAIGSTHKVTYTPAGPGPNNTWRRRAIRCAFTNAPLVQGLVSKTGLGSGKSYIDTPVPTSLPPELQSHYLRGYFDGDGWVNPKDLSTGFVGTPKFLAETVDILVGIGMKWKKVEWNGATDVNKKIRWASVNDWNLLYRFLYRDAGKLYLNRKKVLFEGRLSAKLDGFSTICLPPSHSPN